MDRNIRCERVDGGVLVATIDMPGRTMNVFSSDMMDSLERLLDLVEKESDLRAAVLTSGKPAFIAGADLEMIRDYAERAQIEAPQQLNVRFGRLGRLFRRLEKSRKPFVAAINGLALGGGLEICLACHGRVLSSDERAQIGLPEIKLGLLPGAGGTQRLPRMVGARLGLRMLLSGESLAPEQALALGVVDEVVPPGEVLAAAVLRARAMERTDPPWDQIGARFDSAPFEFGRRDVQEQIAREFGLSENLLRRYPAYLAIMKCVVGAWDLTMGAACEREMEIFVELMCNPVAGNMVRTLFLTRHRAEKPTPTILDARTTQVALIGGGTSRVRRLLETGKVKIVDANLAKEDDIVLLMPGQICDRGIQLRWMTDEGGFDRESAQSVRASVWVAEATSLGRAIEVHGLTLEEIAIDAGILVARWLRGTLLVSRGERLLLPELLSALTGARKASCSEDEEILAVALIAAEIWGEGGIEDVDLADVACVIAGVHPSFTGGPFNYLRQLGSDRIRAKARSASERSGLAFRVPDSVAKLTAGGTLGAFA
jgi:3-hydroxyacyl-CoA dehydrogenase/enoyl-CoA hydratase/3-hydroxybutyryl-CoA epimerase